MEPYPTDFARMTVDLSRFKQLLTPRELRLVSLLAEGLDTKEVAEATGISLSTVRRSMRDIYDKTGMSNRLELALWYLVHYEPLSS